MFEKGKGDRGSEDVEDSFFFVDKWDEWSRLRGGGGHGIRVYSESLEWGWLLSSSSLAVPDFGVGGGFDSSCGVASQGVASQGVGSIVHCWSWSQPFDETFVCLSRLSIG